MAIFDDEQAEARKEIKRYRDLIRREGILRDNMVRQMMGSPDGRAYLRWLLVITGAIGRNPFDPDRPAVTNFQCGQLNIGQTVLTHLVSIDPTNLTILLLEQDSEHKAGSQQSSDTDDSSGSDDGPAEPLGNTEAERYD